MIIQCTSCQARFRFDESKLEGQSTKKVRCSKCAATFMVSAPKPEPAPAPLLPDESEEAPPPAFASQPGDPFAALSAAPPPPVARAKAVLKPVTEERKSAEADSFIIPVAEYNATLTSSATIGIHSGNTRPEIALTPLRAEELSSINIELPAQFGQKDADEDQTNFLAQHFMRNNQEEDPASNASTIKLAAVDDADPVSPGSTGYSVRHSVNREYYQNEERNLKLAPLVRALREVEFDASDSTKVLQIASAANLPTVRSSGKGGRVAVAYHVQPFSGQRSAFATSSSKDLPKAMIYALKGALLMAFLAILLFGAIVAMAGERFNPLRLSLSSLPGLSDSVQPPAPNPATKNDAKPPAP